METQKNEFTEMACKRYQLGAGMKPSFAVAGQARYSRIVSRFTSITTA